MGLVMMPQHIGGYGTSEKLPLEGGTNCTNKNFWQVSPLVVDGHIELQKEEGESLGARVCWGYYQEHSIDDKLK